MGGTGDALVSVQPPSFAGRPEIVFFTPQFVIQRMIH